MPALPDFLIALRVLEVEPVEPAVEEALREAAPESVEAVGDGEDLFGEGLCGLQHGGEPFGEVVAVELEQVVSVSYAQQRSTDELVVQRLQHLALDLVQRVLRVAQQDLLPELVGRSPRLDVADPALVALEAVVHVLVVAEWRHKYNTSMPVWNTPAPHHPQQQLKQLEKL